MKSEAGTTAAPVGRPSSRRPRPRSRPRGNRGRAGGRRGRGRRPCPRTKAVEQADSADLGHGSRRGAQVMASASRRRCSRARSLAGPSSVKIATIARRSRSRPLGVARPRDQLSCSVSSAVSKSPSSQASNARARVAGSSLLDEPRPGGQARGREVALERLEQLRASSASPRASRILPSFDRGIRDGPDRAPAPRAATPRRRRRRAGRPRRGRARRRTASTCAGGIAPVNSAATSPSLNALTAGMPCTPKPAARPWLASTSTLASSTLPSRFAVSASRAGPSCRHGPAPLGPEVDHDRDLAGALDHLLLEGRLVDVVNHGPEA